ncbi:hypothetical protein FDW81_07995 [Pseudarthrobacter sp. NamB4]|nr:hypothetical protein FDW81_07995 [Pseudarthrobacter sp. NamB4]
MQYPRRSSFHVNRDTEQHAGLLSKLGINPANLLGKLPGGLGGKLGGLGLYRNGRSVPCQGLCPLHEPFGEGGGAAVPV